LLSYYREIGEGIADDPAQGFLVGVIVFERSGETTQQR